MRPISKFASHVAQFHWNILHLRDRCLGCARCAPPAVNSAADRDRPRTAPACPHPPALVNGRKLSIVRLAGAAAVALRSIATMPSAAAARVSLTYLRCRCHHAHGKCSEFSILVPIHPRCRCLHWNRILFVKAGKWCCLENSSLYEV